MGSEGDPQREANQRRAREIKLFFLSCDNSLLMHEQSLCEGKQSRREGKLYGKKNISSSLSHT